MHKIIEHYYIPEPGVTAIVLETGEIKIKLSSNQWFNRSELIEFSKKKNWNKTFLNPRLKLFDDLEKKVAESGILNKTKPTG